MKGLLSVALLILAWQFSSAKGLLNPYLLPPPTEVFWAGVDLVKDGSLFRHILASLRRVLIGLSLAFVTAIPLSVLLATRKKTASYLLPLLEVFRPIPPIAWIPLAILWFGVRTDRASNFITFIAAFFPIFLNTFAGLNRIESIHINAARCLGAGKRLTLSDVYFPSILPFLMAGIRTSVGFAWMSVIAAELIASTSGIGYMIEMNRSMTNTANVLCGMAAIGTVGYMMNAGLLWVEHRFSWKA